MSRKPALNRKKLTRLASVGIVILGLSAPALADHFDWTSYDPAAPATAEDAHVTCSEPEEGQDPQEAQDSCDMVVAEVAQELSESDHPENHGKYVSFVAHCLKGMKGKDQKMREVAQAGEDSQMEVAVRVCSEYRLEQEAADTESSEEEAELSDDSKGRPESPGKSGKDGSKGKGKSKGRKK